MADPVQPTVDMVREEIGILRHTLGLDRSDVAYRNHFAASHGHADMPILERCVARGLMVRETSGSVPDLIFRATAEGKDFAKLSLGAAFARAWDQDHA